jgi:hypothetical protein
MQDFITNLYQSLQISKYWRSYKTKEVQTHIRIVLRPIFTVTRFSVVVWGIL